MTCSSWSKEETFRLIEIWGDGSIQTQLDGLKRNSEVFDTISSEMKKSGYEWTVKQCRNKIKKLKVEYRKVKARREMLGDEAKVWEYFDALDNVLRHKMVPHLPQLMDNIVMENTDDDLAQVIASQHDIAQVFASQQDLAQSSEIQQEFSQSSIESQQDLARAVVSQQDLARAVVSQQGSARVESTLQQPLDVNLSQYTDDSGSVTPVRTYQQTMPPEAMGRKRRRSGNEMLVSILGELVEKVVEAKLKSDMKMIELEEKRIKLEEKKIERDAEIRRDERDYQLRMLQCMMDSQFFHPSSSSSNPPSSSLSDANQLQSDSNKL